MSRHHAAALLLLAATGLAHASGFVRVEGATFRSVLPGDPGAAATTVAPFDLQATPVTNADFRAFVAAHPQWRKDRVARLFADEAYLRQWQDPRAEAQQPVVNVSWFAAVAYCEAQGARLPSWHEWEWAAAADASSVDARSDPAWRQQILSWYAIPGGTTLARVAQRRADVRGVHDLHGLVWEWVDDFGSLMVSGDNREQGDPDLDKFCGTGALSMEQKENYAVVMRIAMLSSLQARYTTAGLGFRCAPERAAVMSLRRLWVCALLALAPLAPAAELPGDSLYQLATPLVLQDGRAARLDLNRGAPVVVSMFYGSCPNVCPALIATIKRMEQGLTAPQRARLRVLMVSIDPQRDTPEHLRALAQRHGVDLARWSLAQTPESEVRKLAAALGMQYRKLGDGDFNHATIITLLDADGRIEAQTSVLGRLDPPFVARLAAATAR